MLLAVIALPPVVLERGGVSPLFVSALLAPIVLLHGLRGGVGARLLTTGFLGVLIILFGALLHPAAGVAPAADLARAGMTHSLLSYAMLCMAAYVLRSTGALRTVTVIRVLLLSAAAVAVVYIVQAQGSPGRLLLNGSDAIANPGLLGHRTHFGYFMALGFVVAFGRLVTMERRSIGDHALAFFFLGLALASFTRGAWVIVAATVAVVPFVRGVRGWALLIPAPLLFISSAAVFRDRAFGDVSGGLRNSISSGSFGTNRAQLWQALIEKFLDLPWGRGWGTMWTVTPEQLVGMPGVFVSGGSPFVYAHNDFLFMAIELGFVGLSAFVLFWLDLLRRTAALLQGRALALRREGALLVGPLAVMLVAELFDNGLAMRGLADRFFVLTGILFAISAASRRMEAA